MPQSLDNVLLHLIFSTKDRVPFLCEPVLSDLHGFLAGVTRTAGCDCPRVGGVADHVHLAIRLSRTITIAALVEDLKTSSSRWLKSQSPELSGFAWQRGYAVFSVEPNQLATLVAYIDSQESHHRKWSFEDEYRRLLDEFGVAFDEKYLWD